MSASASYNFAAGGRPDPGGQLRFNLTIVASASPVSRGHGRGGGHLHNGASVTVTATANAGYAFVNWTEGGVEVSASPSYNFAAGGRPDPGGQLRPQTLTIDGQRQSGRRRHGRRRWALTPTAPASLSRPSANPGYAFVNWTEAGAQVSTLASYNFAAGADRTLVANFVQTWTIVASASPVAGGTVAGAGTYTNGASVTVTASANPGYAFVNWTEAGAQVSASASFNFAAGADRTLVANFVQTWTIAASASPVAGGTVVGAGAYTNGASVTVTASANPGYAFVNWTEAGAQVSASASYNFAAGADRTLVANFVQTWTVAASASPVAGGTVAGAGTYTNGASVTVTASTNVGYVFVNWTEAGAQVSGSASYNFAAAADRTLVANFASFPPPQLRILSTPTNTMVLSWPASSTGYRLWEISTLGSAGWTRTTNDVNTVGSDWQVIVSSSLSNCFYRLAPVTGP